MASPQATFVDHPRRVEQRRPGGDPDRPEVGATAIATTRTSAKKQALLDAGAPHVIATEEEDLVAEVMRITGGKGARIVFDPVAGPVRRDAGERDGEGRHDLSLRHSQPAADALPLFKALVNGLTLRGYTLFEITRDPARLSRGVAFVKRGLAEGTLKPIIAKTFPFDQIVEAHRYMESNQQIGKIDGRDRRAQGLKRTPCPDPRGKGGTCNYP